jgi:cyanophycinase
MKNLDIILLIFLIHFTVACLGQEENKGNLFIIGGGERPAALMQSMISSADLKAEDYIIILPMASSIPDTVTQTISRQINSLVVNKIVGFNFKKDEPIDSNRLDSLQNAKLIYITGGDQNKFMNIVLNTPIHKAIKAAYKNGSTIAGTSAGAAVMSKVMITGQQKTEDNPSDFEKIWYNNVATSEGLGLIEKVIIDQHFIARSRFNRLISVMADYPETMCIGIDESTAILVQNEIATVLGEAQVVVLSKPTIISSKAERIITIEDLNFSLLSQGNTFKINVFLK